MTERIEHLGGDFTYEFAPYSVAFIELQQIGRW